MRVLSLGMVEGTVCLAPECFYVSLGASRTTGTYLGILFRVPLPTVQECLKSGTHNN